MENRVDLALRPDFKKTKRVGGHWDLRVSPLTLGGLLIFIEELNLVAEKKSCECGYDIFFSGELKLPIVGQERANQGDLIVLTKAICKNYPLLMMLYEFLGVENIYWSQSSASISLIKSQDCEIWPSENIRAHYRYGTTKYVQNFFKTHGRIPYLSVNLASRTRALDFCKKHLKSEMAVVVHLKNVSSHLGQSNANCDEWFKFFRYCSSRYNAKFILIGNDEPGEEIRKLKNVVVASDESHDIGRDLALIQTASFFMGMASGPCNMAIFGKVPYVIFKDPDHHRLEMQEELGDNDHFIFSGSLQKILRVVQTEQILIEQWQQFLESYRLIGA